MASSQDLMGFGESSMLADLLGLDPVSVTGVGTGQTTGPTVKDTMARLTTSGGATACTLPSNAKIGVPYFVATISATTGIVFVPVGHTLNGSSNGSLNVAQNKMAMFLQVAKGVWFSMLTA